MTDNHGGPGLTTLLSRLARTGSGALQNRVELFAVEWQQERARLGAMLVYTSAFVVMLSVGSVFVTGAIVLALPESWRLYAAAGFGIAYSVCAALAWGSLRSHLERAAFPATLDQLKKDGLWLDSSKTES